MKTNEEPIYGIKAVKCLLDIGMNSDAAIRLAYPYITAREKELLTAEEWIRLFRVIRKDRQSLYRDEVFEWAQKRSIHDFSDSISLANAMMSGPGKYKKEWWSFLLGRIGSFENAEYLYYCSDGRINLSQKQKREVWSHWLNLVISHNNQEIVLTHLHKMWIQNKSQTKKNKLSQRQAEILWRAILGKSKKWDDLKWLYKETEEKSKKAIVYRKMKKLGRSFTRRRWLFENKAKYSYPLILETVRSGLRNYKTWDDFVWLCNLAKDNYHNDRKLFVKVYKILIDNASIWKKKLFAYEYCEFFHKGSNYHNLLLNQANTYERATALWEKTPRDSEKEVRIEWRIVELIENIEQACQMIIIIKQREHYGEKSNIGPVQIKDLVPKIKKVFAKSKEAIEYFLNTMRKYHSDLLKQGSDFLPLIEETLVSFEDWKWYFEKRINPNLAYEKMFALAEKVTTTRSSQDAKSLSVKRYQYLYGAVFSCYFTFEKKEEYQQRAIAKISSFKWFLERMEDRGNTKQRRFDFFQLARRASDNGYDEIIQLLSIAEEHIQFYSDKDRDKEMVEKFKKEHAEIIKLAIDALSFEELSQISFASLLANNHQLLLAMKEKAREPRHWTFIHWIANNRGLLELEQEAEDQLLIFLKSAIDE